jgi:hypothetical protein
MPKVLPRPMDTAEAAFSTADHYWLCLHDFGDLGVIRSLFDFE